MGPCAPSTRPLLGHSSGMAVIRSKSDSEKMSGSCATSLAVVPSRTKSVDYVRGPGQCQRCPQACPEHGSHVGYRPCFPPPRCLLRWASTRHRPSGHETAALQACAHGRLGAGEGPRSLCFQAWSEEQGGQSTASSWAGLFPAGPPGAPATGLGRPAGLGGHGGCPGGRPPPVTGCSVCTIPPPTKGI